MKTASSKSKQNGTPAASKPAQKNSKSPANGKQSSSEVAKGLRDLFEDMLKDIYWAEKALTKAIPKMIKNSSSDELTMALKDHLAVTIEQVARVEQVFQVIGKTARAKKCEAMDGLIKEAEEIMESTEAGVVRDAGIIAAAQKVEHYEIASYGTLRAFAQTLGEEEAAALLQETLDEEKEADETLTDVAEGTINIEAAEADGDNEENEEEEEEIVTPAGRSNQTTKSKKAMG